MSSDVGAAGVGLVVAAPGRPLQAVCDGAVVAAVEVEESADFSEGERNQAPVNGRCGFVVLDLCGRRGHFFWLSAR